MEILGPKMELGRVRSRRGHRKIWLHHILEICAIWVWVKWVWVYGFLVHWKWWPSIFLHQREIFSRNEQPISALAFGPLPRPYDFPDPSVDTHHLHQKTHAYGVSNPARLCLPKNSPRRQLLAWRTRQRLL